VISRLPSRTRPLDRDQQLVADTLVPFVGSRAAERVLRPAFELVCRTGVLWRRVLQRAAAGDAETTAPYLAGVADRYAGVTDVETTMNDRENVPDSLSGGSGHGTLVCMSSHGRGGIARALLGSVAEALLRTINRPVLVVVCIDGSTGSEHIVEPSRAWGSPLGLPLWIVGVAVPGAPVDWPAPGRQGGVGGPGPARVGDVVPP
jgi:Universal stress protein family